MYAWHSPPRAHKLMRMNGGKRVCKENGKLYNRESTGKVAMSEGNVNWRERRSRPAADVLSTFGVYPPKAGASKAFPRIAPRVTHSVAGENGRLRPSRANMDLRLRPALTGRSRMLPSRRRQRPSITPYDRPLPCVRIWRITRRGPDKGRCGGAER
jgi:hypothetical protein